MVIISWLKNLFMDKRANVYNIYDNTVEVYWNKYDKWCWKNKSGDGCDGWVGFSSQGSAHSNCVGYYMEHARWTCCKCKTQYKYHNTTQYFRKNGIYCLQCLEG